MKKVLFIDRDGTIIAEPPDEQVDSFDKMEFLPGVIGALSKIAAETDYELVMVTNQDGLGTASFPEETFWPVHNKVMGILKGEGICFSEIFIDRTFPADKAPTRKPGTAMLTKYLAGGVDLNASFVIGDRETDIQLAENLGCRAIFIGTDNKRPADLVTTDWNEIYRYLKSIPRTAEVVRKTNETEIRVKINLDGKGTGKINTGNGFLDHMLDQLSRHGGFDIEIDARGDTHIDMHHLTEDIAICLGEAFIKAMGKKKGIARYSFVLPMDDALAQVAVDTGGRPWLVWEVSFSSPMLGEMPAEMFFHFFKSFTDNARINLNIKATGDNDHHKIESVFKAFAKAMGSAVKITGDAAVPSTKGII